MCARKGEKNDFGFCADDGNLEDMEKGESESSKDLRNQSCRTEFYNDQ